jgi:hypothetical protein
VIVKKYGFVNKLKLCVYPPVRMQDLPPKGGFDGSFVYKRNLPSKGPNGAVLLTAVTVMIGCGLFLHRRSVHLMQ